ncbi:MAG TPA: site-2 protease family protein [Bdellovibrionales bacterium]|nr:site-2 protease family protein [Bdellovibrionales bacterium]
MAKFDMLETAVNVMKFFVPFLFALCFHEFAHGWVARLRGDRTAEIMGRLTMNPLAHADPLGTFFLPIISVITHVPLFGWAKPVPVDERNLKNPRVDMFWIAVAGPLSNVFLAIVGAGIAGIYVKFNLEAVLSRDQVTMHVFDVMKMFILMNLYLALFNLLPVHPLDGGKVIARFLPEDVNRKLEEMQNYTSILLLILFVSGAFALIAGPAQWLGNLFLTNALRMAGLS